MTFADFINGGFEFLGGAIVWLNVRKLWRDKCVRGAYWQLSGFFAVFACWSLYFYASLGQTISFAGALVLSTGNVTWFLLALLWRNH